MSTVHDARFTSSDLEQRGVEVFVSGWTAVSARLVDGPGERRQTAAVVVHGVLGDAAVSREVRGRAEELGGASGARQEPCGRHAEVLELARQLVGLIVTGEQRSSSDQLGHDTAKTPHVHRRAVPRTEDHLNTQHSPHSLQTTTQNVLWSRASVCVSVCPRPYAHITAPTRM